MRDTSKYTIDGNRVVSVTESLGFAGLPNFAGIPAEILAHAAARGREVHSWCDLDDQGLIEVGVVPDEPINHFLSAYRTFKSEFGFKLIELEKIVRSERYGFVGTLDRLCYLRNHKRYPRDPFVIDIKTPQLISAVDRLQVAGYAIALQEMDSKLRTVRRGAVQLRVDGRYRWTPHEDPSDAHDFLSTIRVAHFKLRHNLVVIGD